MDYIEAKAGKPTPRPALTREEFLEKFARAASDHFDPDLHLRAHRRGEPDDDAGARVARHRRGRG